MKIKNLSAAIIIVLSLISSRINAQSAYHGGKGDGYASAEADNIVLALSPTGGLNQVISVYPNPAKNSQNLEILCDGRFQAVILNLLGVSVFSGNNPGGKAMIPLSGLTPGTYILRVRSGNQSFTEKFVII